MMWDMNCYANNTAVIDEEGKTYSYQDVGKAGNDLIERMHGRCLVFCLCTNEIGSLIGYTAFVNHRIVPLLLDSGLEKGLLNSLIETYKPDYLWIPKAQENEFSSYDKVVEANAYLLLKTPYNHVFPLHDDLALLLTTSGSTGSAKLVRQSYVNIKANTESIIGYLGLDETERPITTLPMSYTYGLSIINSHLLVGASIILTRKTLMEKEFWQQFKEYGATSFGGVPFIYEMLNKLRFFKMELPSLKTMTQAGGKLSPELHRKFAEYAQITGKRFVVMYGQTEATARMAYLPADKALDKCGSMGIAIPGGSFSLIDTFGGKIDAPNITGELVYEGKNVTLGYAQAGEDLLKGDERNGILETGDMARRDEDGYYYIVGRKKRFLKIFGSRVNLDETEQLIKEAFSDMEAACAGMDDKMHVFITDARQKNEVLRFLTEKLHLNHTAFVIKTIEAIPKTESGKVQYIALEKFYD